VRAAAAAHEGLQLCNYFREVSTEEVRQLPTRLPVKSSALDPLPTFIQRELVDVLTNSAVTVFNPVFILHTKYPHYIVLYCIVTPTVRDTCADGI